LRVAKRWVLATQVNEAGRERVNFWGEGKGRGAET